MASLDIQNVSKAFAELNVLKDISLGIGDGDFLVLVGPSGCGKSTLLNMIAGLLDLTAGHILIDGKPVENLEPKDRDIAMVFQSYALYPAMTVRKNIAFPLRMAGFSKEEQQSRVDDVAQLLQIDKLLDRKPSQLSGGQRQRVAMGRALVRDPKIFLFDEPLSNLDAKLRVDMRTEIKRLHQRLKATIVYVTHDQVEAMTMATKIAVMKNGEIQQFGSPAEIYDSPSNTFVATFMGSPAMNLIEGTVSKGGAILLPGNTVVPTDGVFELPTEGEKVLVGLRPEWFSTSSGDESNHVEINATIDVLEPTGPDIYAALKIEDRNIMARLPAGSELHEGETRSFSIDTSKIVLFDVASGEALRRKG